MAFFTRNTPPYHSVHYIPDMNFNHGDQIATGSTGTIYHVTGTNLILKMQSLLRAPVNHEEDPVQTYSTYKRDKTAKFNHEAKMALLMGNLGIGPKVYGYWTCDNANLTYFGREGKGEIQLKDKLGFILMEKVNGLTVEEYSKTYPVHFRDNYKTIEKLIRNKVESIAKSGYYGFDILPCNIMVSFSDTPQIIDDIVMIDFGDYREEENAMQKMQYVFQFLRKLNVRRSKRIKKI
jgi:hypothetical protein